MLRLCSIAGVPSAPGADGAFREKRIPGKFFDLLADDRSCRRNQKNLKIIDGGGKPWENPDTPLCHNVHVSGDDPQIQ